MNILGYDETTHGMKGRQQRSFHIPYIYIGYICMSALASVSQLFTSSPNKPQKHCQHARRLDTISATLLSKASRIARACDSMQFAVTTICMQQHTHSHCQECNLKSQLNCDCTFLRAWASISDFHASIFAFNSVSGIKSSSFNGVLHQTRVPVKKSLVVVLSCTP